MKVMGITGVDDRLDTERFPGDDLGPHLTVLAHDLGKVAEGMS